MDLEQFCQRLLDVVHECRRFIFYIDYLFLSEYAHREEFVFEAARVFEEAVCLSDYGPGLIVAFHLLFGLAVAVVDPVSLDQVTAPFLVAGGTMTEGLEDGHYPLFLLVDVVDGRHFSQVLRSASMTFQHVYRFELERPQVMSLHKSLFFLCHVLHHVKTVLQHVGVLYFFDLAYFGGIIAPLDKKRLQMIFVI